MGFVVGYKEVDRGSLATTSATKQRSDAGAYGCSISDFVAVSDCFVAESSKRKPSPPPVQGRKVEMTIWGGV